MILADHCIAMNVHAGGIAFYKDPAAESPRTAVAHNDATTELAVQGRFEVNAGALAQCRVQSIVGDAAAPHAQRASLAPDPSPAGTARGVYRIRLNAAAGDFGLAILNEEAASSTGCRGISTLDDVPSDGGLLYSHLRISAKHTGAGRFVRTIAGVVTSHDALLKADGGIQDEEAAASSI